MPTTTAVRDYFKQSDRRNIIVLTGIAATLLIAGLWRNGYAYTYYTVAAQAGSQSWKALFFGSTDSSNFMMIDKPPLAVWISSLSVRAFGFSPLWILLPHALAGVASVIVLYKTMRRCFDEATSFLAGLLFAITPATIVVFRYNMTDSFLILFLLLAIYSFLRSMEESQLTWLVLSGVFIGFGFNSKMTQSLIIVPIFVIMYFYNSPAPILKRLGHVTAHLVSVITISLWWVVIVSFVPAHQRPWIGSTQGNSIWELVLLHNGFARFLGSNWQQPTGETDAGVAFGGQPGAFRMFNTGFGPNIIWFFLIAIVGTFLTLWAYDSLAKHKKREIKNHVGLWFFMIVVYGVIFSFTKGTIHPYYSVTFVPGISALAAITMSTIYSADVSVEKKTTIRHAVISLCLLTVLVFVPFYVMSGPEWAKIISIIALVVVGIVVLLYVLAGAFMNTDLQRQVLHLSFITLFLVALSLSIASIISIQYGFMPTTQPLPEVYNKFQRPETSIPENLKDFFLTEHQDEKWIVATSSTIQSAPIQLSTGLPAMSLGGFSGNDNPLSLNEFKALVDAGDVRYYAINQRQTQVYSVCLGVLMGRDISTGVNPGCRALNANNEKSTASIENWATTRLKVNDVSNAHWQVYDLVQMNQNEK